MWPRKWRWSGSILLAEAFVIGTRMERDGTPREAADLQYMRTGDRAAAAVSSSSGASQTELLPAYRSGVKHEKGAAHWKSRLRSQAQEKSQERGHWDGLRRQPHGHWRCSKSWRFFSACDGSFPECCHVSGSQQGFSAGTCKGAVQAPLCWFAGGSAWGTMVFSWCRTSA